MNDLYSDGLYCVQCKRKVENNTHDSKKDEAKTHHMLPFSAVHLVNQAKKDHHFGVFEHVQYSFNIEGVSRVLTHQLVRHRLASYAQLSARKVATKSYVLPPYDDEIRKEIADELDHQWDRYQHLIDDKGVNPEDARYLVGDGQTTAIIMTLNARTLGHFLLLRLDERAQWEIRALANEILRLVIPTAPIIWEKPFPE